jgi:hypothetical protein
MASIDRLGALGSWMCRTSKSLSEIQRRTRALAVGPKLNRATDPLYGMASARPADTTKSGNSMSSEAGARTLTLCPRSINTSARSTTWACTPPGTSNEYGQTMPIFTGSPYA